MIIFLLIWTAMAALALACASQFEFHIAVATWSVTAAVTCAMGAFLISRQPLGMATSGGRCGSAVVRWGFRAGHGQLTLAAIISWLIWLILGTSTIAAANFPANLPILVACTGDLLGLFYVIGVMLANRSRRITASLAKMVAALVALMAGSMSLWFRGGSDQARAIAIAIAGGPPLLVAAIYGFVLAMHRFSGRTRSH